MNPQYPVYVISKGRWESRLTVKALQERSIPFHVVIEPQEYQQYSSVIPEENIKVLPFSNLGQGSIPARNWVWEDSISLGFDCHWILDDNISHFYRLNSGMKYRTTDGSSFYATECFVDRFINVSIAGMQYEMFVARRKKHPPFVINTRVYSCILIKNNIPYRWRGRYNEDTDLCLRVLKDGGCTILMNAFLADKRATMKMKGGNTEELYKLDGQKDGRLLMAQSLQQQHPDVTKIVWKWNRWQHEVDYRPFKKNKLIKKPGVVIPTGNNEYGMVLKKRS